MDANEVARIVVDAMKDDPELFIELLQDGEFEAIQDEIAAYLAEEG